MSAPASPSAPGASAIALARAEECARQLQQAAMDASLELLEESRNADAHVLVEVANLASTAKLWIQKVQP